MTNSDPASLLRPPAPANPPVGRVRLRTLVRVEEEWTEKDRKLQEFGYKEDEI